MKIKEGSRVKESNRDAPRAGTGRNSLKRIVLPEPKSRAKKVGVPVSRSVKKVVPVHEEEEKLNAAIDDALLKVEQTRLVARSHDEEMRRLGEETRGLIAEMLRDLNLKAA